MPCEAEKTSRQPDRLFDPVAMDLATVAIDTATVAVIPQSFPD
jgi:hypothetical protein